MPIAFVSLNMMMDYMAHMHGYDYIQPVRQRPSPVKCHVSIDDVGWRTDEARGLAQSEFAWDWRQAGEPERLAPHDFVEDRLWRLVRRALEKGLISLGRAAEIVGLTLDDMRTRARAWSA